MPGLIRVSSFSRVRIELRVNASSILTFAGIFGTVQYMKKGVDHIGVGVGAIIDDHDNRVFCEAGERGQERIGQMGVSRRERGIRGDA